MKKALQPLRVLAIAGMTLLVAQTGCASQEDSNKNQKTEQAATAETTQDKKVLAEVDGKQITQTDYDLYIKQRNASNPRAGTDQQMVLEELVNRELLAKDAQGKGMDKKPEYLQALENQRLNMLAGYAINQEVLARGKPSDEELKAEYDRIIGAMSKNEYKARHILVKTEDEAKAVIASLTKGGDFAKLAKQKSVDSSAAEGGELGWLAPEQMPPSFAEALATLKPKAYTKTPVQTQAGWHVIKLDETRPAQIPEFDSVKNELTSSLVNKRIQEYVKSLRDKAKVSINK